jgi:hypothetical protein
LFAEEDAVAEEVPLIELFAEEDAVVEEVRIELFAEEDAVVEEVPRIELFDEEDAVVEEVRIELFAEEDAVVYHVLVQLNDSSFRRLLPSDWSMFLNCFRLYHLGLLYAGINPQYVSMYLRILN